MSIPASLSCTDRRCLTQCPRWLFSRLCPISGARSDAVEDGIVVRHAHAGPGGSWRPPFTALLPRSFRPLSCLPGAYAISEARFQADQQFEAPSPNQRGVRHLGSARRRTGWRSIVMCRRRVRSDPRTPCGTGNSSRFKVAGPARTAWVKAASSSGVSCCSGLAGAGSAANSGRPPPSATSPSPAHPVSVRLQRSWLRSARTGPQPRLLWPADSGCSTGRQGSRGCTRVPCVRAARIRRAYTFRSASRCRSGEQRSIWVGLRASAFDPRMGADRR